MTKEVEKPLTPFELDLITFLDQRYRLDGELMTAERAEQEYGIPFTDFVNALANKTFRAALAERGVIFERFSENQWTSKSLTAEQLAAANVLLDLTDTRSTKKKLQDLSISTQRYQSWLRDPVFKDYLHTRAEQLLGDNQHEAHMALMDKVRLGDIKAISYFNEMMGRFTPQRASASGASTLDLQNILIKVIEIIDLHVKDSDTKLAIANDFKKLVAARNMAAALADSDELTVPEVAEAPVISQIEGPKASM